jgi:Flp pilus assembly protein TadB
MIELPQSGRRLPEVFRRWRVQAQRLALIGGGLVLMVLGIASVPTPVPIGFILFAVGLYLVARGSKRARRSVKRLRRHVPPLSRGLNRLKPRMPNGMRAFIEHSDPGE